jgi:NUMOD4 motif
MAVSEVTVSDTPPWPEEWKPVPGFSSYEASCHGRVRSVDRVNAAGRRMTGRIMATRVSNKGYVLVNMTDDKGTKQTRTVHTVVLTAFAGQCPPGQEACHRDDNPLHNWWHPDPETTNLHWARTRSTSGSGRRTRPQRRSRSATASGAARSSTTAGAAAMTAWSTLASGPRACSATGPASPRRAECWSTRAPRACTR